MCLHCSFQKSEWRSPPLLDSPLSRCLVKKNWQQTKSRGNKSSSFSTMFVQFPYLNPQALEKYREGSYITSSTQNWVSTSERQRSVHWNDPVTLTAPTGHQTSQISGHGANPGTGFWSQQYFWSRGEQILFTFTKRGTDCNSTSQLALRKTETSYDLCKAMKRLSIPLRNLISC